MKRFLPRFFSIVFHPLLAVFYSVLLIFYSGHYHWLVDIEMFFAVLLIFFALTFVLPAILIPFLYYQQVIPDLFLKGHKSRFPVYLSITVLYVISFFLMNRFAFPALLKNIMMAGTVIISVITIIGWFYNISTHTTAMGTLTGLCLFLGMQIENSFVTELIVFFIISGIIASSRLLLGYHKPHEVYTGFLLGFTGIIASLFVLS
ncbi:MAG: hypothetical protein ACOCVX_01890 [Bacteroidales bacterium]